MVLKTKNFDDCLRCLLRNIFLGYGLEKCVLQLHVFFDI